MAAIPNGERLDGWKAIANFLGRERTTAIRWAKERGLPVHRVPGGRTGTVYALRSELEAWLSSDRDDAATAADAVAAVAAEPLGATPLPEAERAAFGTGARAAALIAAAALIMLLAALLWRGSAPNPPVSVAAVVSPNASRDTLDFARGLNADLARFANSSPDLAVFEREPGASPGTEYAVRTDIEHAGGKVIANARLIAVPHGQVIWSRRFEQSGPSLSALREQVAATIIGALRCSFGLLASERPKARPADIEQLIAICQSSELDDMTAALSRARKLTQARPDLAVAWSTLARLQSHMALDGDAHLKQQAIENSRRAAAIAPKNVSTFLALAAASGDGPTSRLALPAIDAGLRVHPDEPLLLNNRSVILFNLGYVNDSVADAMNSVRSDPSSFSGRDIAVRRLAAAGRLQDAQELQAENERLWPGHPGVIANQARIAPRDSRREGADAALIAEYERDIAASPHGAYTLARLYERTGDRQAALAWLARAPVDATFQQWSVLFWPDAAGLRAEPAFFRKMADLGLVRWWRARGKWPDFCSEPGLRYDCAEEAKKLG